VAVVPTTKVSGGYEARRVPPCEHVERSAQPGRSLLPARPERVGVSEDGLTAVETALALGLLFVVSFPFALLVWALWDRFA
jgi:hypothetical protein